MTYWMHRCWYEGGFDILDQEHRLTIGFADCAKDEAMVEAIRKKDGKAFDAEYESVYGGEIKRASWSLWYFTVEMSIGDTVVVPRAGGFTICRIISDWQLSSRRDELDIGFERSVEILADMCAPREDYASTALLARMKYRGTNLRCDDLEADIDDALQRFKENKPFALANSLAEHCHKMLEDFGSPKQFEDLIANYFRRLGGDCDFAPNSIDGNKHGDCDISATFPALKLTISVQAKKHWGQTDDWAVTQITDYDANIQKDSDWSYVQWVISFADEFTEEAKNKATESGVILINGKEFCRMLIASGLDEN